MRLIVAEKPAVARAICPAVGARKKQEGYFEGGGWLVSWCYGHLAEMPYPDQIKPEWAGKWDLSQLPMIPEEWQLRVRDDAIGRCPNCGSDVIEGKYGPMCVGKCGMYPGKLYGQDLTLAQVKKLLSGKKVACTINGRKTTVLPETVKRTFGGKTYCNWKTESAAPEKEGAAAIRKKGAAR